MTEEEKQIEAKIDEFVTRITLPILDAAEDISKGKNKGALVLAGLCKSLDYFIEYLTRGDSRLREIVVNELCNKFKGNLWKEGKMSKARMSVDGCYSFKWIPISEQKPPKNRNIILANSQEDDILIGWIDSQNEVYVDMLGWYSNIEHFDYWAEFPPVNFKDGAAECTSAWWNTL